MAHVLFHVGPTPTEDFMRHSGRAALRATLVLAIGGCSDPTAFSPNLAPADVSGTWALSAVIATSGGSDACTASGTATIAQSGTELEGSTHSTLTCSTPGGSVNLTGLGSLDGGVRDAAVTFRDAECEYRGTVSSGASMGGTVSCSIFFGGAMRAYAGSWEARRT